MEKNTKAAIVQFVLAGIFFFNYLWLKQSLFLIFFVIFVVMGALFLFRDKLGLKPMK